MCELVALRQRFLESSGGNISPMRDLFVFEERSVYSGTVLSTVHIQLGVILQSDDINGLYKLF